MGVGMMCATVEDRPGVIEEGSSAADISVCGVFLSWCRRWGSEWPGKITAFHRLMNLSTSIATRLFTCSFKFLLTTIIRRI